MSNEKINYSFWANVDEWSLADASYILVNYNQELLVTNGITNTDIVNKYLTKLKYNLDAFTDEIISCQSFSEFGNPEYDDNNNEIWLTDENKTKVNIIDFIKWAYRERIPLPQEIMDIVKRKSSVAPLAPDIASTAPNEKNIKAFADLPLLKKQVAELSAEKVKWDASIEAAARVSLLFYEGQLDKPTTKDDFIEKFTEQLGKGLHNSTIEKIYKMLPTDYKLKGGRPKKNIVADNSNPASDSDIMAAVYAGSIFEHREAKDPGKLKLELKDNDYKVPSNVILEKIVAAVKVLNRSD